MSRPGVPTETHGGRRTKPAAQRRRDLLDAGLRVFLDNGVAAARVDQITQAAGVAKGSFYLHFGSKEELLAALQADHEGERVRRVDAAVASAAGAPWPARLDVWLGAALRDYPNERALHDVLYHHPLLPEPEPESAGRAEAPRDLVDSLAELVEAGVAAGAFRVDDPLLTAMLLCSALHRAFDHIWHRDEARDLDRLTAALTALFHRALGAVAGE